MRASDIFFVAGFFAAIPALSQTTLAGPTDKAREILDCHKGRFAPARKASELNGTWIVEIAIATAKREKADLTKYELSSICFDASMPTPSWIVHFEGIVPAPGNNFFVAIRDRDRNAELFWGR